jgi:hypothetical protein
MDRKSCPVLSESTLKTNGRLCRLLTDWPVLPLMTPSRLSPSPKAAARKDVSGQLSRASEQNYQPFPVLSSL